MFDHLSLHSPVDQMYTHASKLERNQSGEIWGGGEMTSTRGSEIVL